MIEWKAGDRATIHNEYDPLKYNGRVVTLVQLGHAYEGEWECREERNGNRIFLGENELRVIPIPTLAERQAALKAKAARLRASVESAIEHAEEALRPAFKPGDEAIVSHHHQVFPGAHVRVHERSYRSSTPGIHWMIGPIEESYPADSIPEELLLPVPKDVPGPDLAERMVEDIIPFEQGSTLKVTEGIHRWVQLAPGHREATILLQGCLVVATIESVPSRIRAFVRFLGPDTVEGTIETLDRAFAFVADHPNVGVNDAFPPVQPENAR